MIQLHGHQVQLVDAIRDAYRRGKRAPLVVLPTGGGKTTVFSYITHGAAAKGNCIYLLAHRSELIKQISLTLARFEVEHNIIAPHAIVRQAKVEHFMEFKRSYVSSASRVIVASVQTIVRRLATLKYNPSLIVIDEAHHLTANTQWGAVVSRYPDAKLLPVTATPCRLDGKGLGIEAGGFADDMVIGAPMRWLIDNGYLSEYRIFSPPPVVDLTGIKKRMGDYAKDQLETAMDKPTITGDAVRHYKRLIPGKRAIAFCVTVKHGQHVAETFRAAGIPSEMLETHNREAAIQRFRDGETLVLTSCEIVSEGFDLPAIEAAILLRPTHSTSLYLQQVGRALRVMEGKQCAVILDHVGNTLRHDLPDADREWSLDGAKKRRKNEEKAVSVARCSKCFAMFKPQPVCPQCGAVMAGAPKERKIQQVDGELVEITPEQMKARQIVRKREESQCRTLEDFIELGKSRGYAYPTQWAQKRYSFRQRKA